MLVLADIFVYLLFLSTRSHPASEAIDKPLADNFNKMENA